jgi:hypothetical protein
MMCKTNSLRPGTTFNGATGIVAALEALASMPGELAATIAVVSPALCTKRPSAGGFSLLEQTCHLRDIEIEAYRVRLERMLTEVAPELPDVDGGALAEARDYHRQDLRLALGAFAGVRADMVSRLMSLSVAERERTGVLSGVGEITIDGLVAKMLEHDGEHRAELAALKRELLGR